MVEYCIYGNTNRIVVFLPCKWSCRAVAAEPTLQGSVRPPPSSSRHCRTSCLGKLGHPWWLNLLDKDGEDNKNIIQCLQCVTKIDQLLGHLFRGWWITLNTNSPTTLKCSQKKSAQVDFFKISDTYTIFLHLQPQPSIQHKLTHHTFLQNLTKEQYIYFVNLKLLWNVVIQHYSPTFNKCVLMYCII